MPAKQLQPSPPQTADWQQLAADNLRLVHWTLQRYFPYVRTLSAEDQEDIAAEGMVALTAAARGYRPESGQFSTYAVACIRRRMFQLWKMRNTMSRGSGKVQTFALSSYRTVDGEPVLEGRNSLLLRDDPLPDTSDAASDAEVLLRTTALNQDQRTVLAPKPGSSATSSVDPGVSWFPKYRT
jgi:RNA polymerase sigma factor (sigma-70 family)